MPHGAETREKIFLLRAEDLGDRLALASDDGEVVFGDPEKTLEQALAIEQLAGLDFQHPALGILHRFFAAEGGGIEPEAFLGEQQRLDLAEVAEVLFGEDEADQRGTRLPHQLLLAAAVGSEQDFPGFLVFAGFDAAVADLLDQHLLLVEVLLADGFAGGFAVGGFAGKAGGRVGGEGDGGY